jgi:hypothetical protein
MVLRAQQLDLGIRPKFPAFYSVIADSNEFPLAKSDICNVLIQCYIDCTPEPDIASRQANRNNIVRRWIFSPAFAA